MLLEVTGRKNKPKKKKKKGMDTTVNFIVLFMARLEKNNCHKGR